MGFLCKTLAGVLMFTALQTAVMMPLFFCRLFLSTFTLAVSAGAVLLLPFSIISNEILLSFSQAQLFAGAGSQGAALSWITASQVSSAAAAAPAGLSLGLTISWR